MKNRIIRFIRIILIFALFNNGIDISADVQIGFKNITIEDGLSQASVETILQDSEGYIWFGTNDGLNKYNGYEVEVFRYSRSSKNSLINNYIVDLKEDDKGNIWVGTASGVSKIHKDRETISNYTVGEGLGNLSHNNIGEILITNDNKVLIGTADGLNLYNEEIDSFERILMNNELVDEFINSLAQDYEGNIWVGTSKGANKIDIKNRRVYYYKTYDGEESDAIHRVFCDGNNVWLGTVNSGLINMDLYGNEVKRYINNENDEKSLPANLVRDIYKDSRGNVWIGTSDGLAKYNNQFDGFTVYKSSGYDKASLVDNSIFKIFEDKNGLMWIGTYGGVSKFDPDNKIKHYKNNPLDSSSLNNNMILGIYEDCNGYIWIGTNTSGINILNKKFERIAEVNTKSLEQSLTSNKINDITGDKDNIYIATYNGVNVLNIKEKNLSVYDKNNGLPDGRVTDLYIDNLGNLWIGTVAGIVVLDKSTNSIIDITYILKNKGIKDVYIKKIYQDSKGNMWIGSFIDGGLTKIDINNREVINYMNNINNINSITNNSIRDIIESSNGDLWIGTSYGVNKLNVNTGEFVGYTVEEGLSNNTVYGILIDDDGNPWMSTNMGISKYDTKIEKFINFDVNDGLQSNEFNGNSAFKSSTGEFLFGGINGLNVFDPNEIISKNSELDIIFDTYMVNGIRVGKIDDKAFKSNDNNIYIKMFLPDYKNIDRINYYYCLVGSNSNSQWTKMDNNEITFSNLAPGQYELKVVAVSNGGVSQEKIVSFKIKQPFLKSGYSMLVYIFIIAAAIYLNKRRVKNLNRIVQERTLELTDEMKRNEELYKKVIELEKRKNSYFINLSHELRTPLNVLYSTEQLIRELNKSDEGIDKNRLNHYMDITRGNIKRLLKLINDIIDIGKIEHGSYVMNVKEHDIVYLVEETALNLNDYIRSKGIELIIDPHMEDKIIWCDGSQIERCIVNLIGNAVKFTNEGGTIQVNIYDLEEKVKIEVVDDGIGIDEKYHKFIFDRFNQVVDNESEVKGGSGLGLTITKHIVDMHYGEIYVESAVNKGSKFIIILPVKCIKN